ncbi:MAG: hypothetical protein ABIA02_03395 [Candidatus Falkowbacteria bacterium]
MKKINKKVIYLIIAVVILGSAGFFIYKNYSITADLPAITSSVSIKKEAKDIMKKANAKEIGSLNINIFSNEKFIKLKENIVDYKKVEVGRNNPFENPF